VLSQTAEYALRTVLHIAGDGAAPHRVERLAQDLGIPRNYLSKTLHQLARAGVLDSTRGPGGGFRLARDPHRIRLIEVVQPFDDIGQGRRCLLGRPVCSERTACEAHERWKDLSERLAAFFRETTVGDLMRGGR
jgi:Rrf2 family iron-sulfur cluster assembly transcriptional regulator